PDVVIVTLSTRDWTRNDTRGGYTAHYLMNARDVPDAVRELQLNATQAADLAAASLSKFWATRAEIRNFVLGHLMPDLGELMRLTTVADPSLLADDEVEAIVRDRIVTLKAL